MSTYYYTKICVRKREDESKSNDNPWKVLDSGCVNIFKNLLNGWDPKVESIDVGNDLINLANTHYTYDSIGTFLKSDIIKAGYSFCKLDEVDPMFEYHWHKNDKDSDFICLIKSTTYNGEVEPIIMNDSNEEEFKKFKEEQGLQVMTPRDIEFYKKEHNGEMPYLWKSMEDAINNDDKDLYVNVYVKKECHYQGSFYERSAFINYKNKAIENYKKVVAKKAKWDSMKDSIEYLKLSEKEKERVSENFEYVDEELEDLEYEIEACNYFINLGSWFDDDRSYEDEHMNYRGHEVYFYIYAQ